MLELFESSQDHLPPIKEEEISDDKVLEEIKSLKKSSPRCDCLRASLPTR